MAVYFQNTLIRSADFLKTSNRYSSAQSLSRAKKKGLISLNEVGGELFAPATAEQTAKLYSVTTWADLPLVAAENLPAGLTIISRLSKTIKVREATIIEWGLFNRLDVYWVAGSFFANAIQAGQLAVSEKK